jgi:hypothetical protein
MLAKTSEARLDKVYSASLLLGKMRIWQTERLFCASVEEMLAKLARSSYSEGGSAVAVS